MALRLKKVTEDDYSFLYDLLSEKTPEQNISHVKMPSYADHCAFNAAQPYAEDYIILESEMPVGRVYMTKNKEIGIHILKKHQKKGIASRVLKMMKNTHDLIYANISPKNAVSIQFFEKQGFAPHQITYKYEA